jgi:hypothetical protein
MIGCLPACLWQDCLTVSLLAPYFSERMQANSQITIDGLIDRLPDRFLKARLILFLSRLKKANMHFALSEFLGIFAAYLAPYLPAGRQGSVEYLLT